MRGRLSGWFSGMGAPEDRTKHKLTVTSSQMEPCDRNRF
jgi:hypothetical protein